MFGFVTASVLELTKEQRRRYNAVYCGICRQILLRCSQFARLGLSYDMAFLALLHMSLYEPEELSGKNACLAHPFVKRGWVDNDCVRYAADLNVVLAYYNLVDDWQDDGKHSARLLAEVYEKQLPAIEARLPRQCEAIRRCIERLNMLEKENCPNPDEPAGCFGALMAELFVREEDLWAEDLRQLGFYLGRFIYLLDAAADYGKDLKRGKYNPYIAMGTGENWEKWKEYLVLTMGRCTQSFERLPLVQDKDLLDNILYSGVWANYKRKRKKENQT